MMLYGSWLRLPLSTRVLVAKEFGIAKTGPTHVQDNVVVSDGYKIHEVEAALAPEKLQEFTGSKSEDHETLWELMLEKVDPKEETPVIEDTSKTAAESMAQPEKQKVVIIDKPKRGRPKKI